MKRILVSLVIISSVLLFISNTSGAFFNDTESSIDNSFQAGAFDLTVNGQNDPEAIVELTDLKPGDDRLIEKDLFIENDAYIFLHIKDIFSEQNIQTEPEDLEESQDGVKFDLENYITYDLKILGDPDEVLVDFNNESTLHQMHSCWIPLGIIPGSETTTIEQSFHFPDDITNWAQGDKTTFTEDFYAEQARHNNTPTPPDTGSGRVWDSENKHCIDCEEGETFASSSPTVSQGLRNNGTPVNTNRSDPSQATGEPDTVNLADPKWFSLGFGGSITLKFTFPVEDDTGSDLSFHEITGGRNNYPIETADVQVSQNGTSWESLGTVDSEPGGDGVYFLDLSTTSFDWIQYVRITDTTDPNIHSSTADGFDLDSVDAVYGTCQPIN